MTTSAYPAVLMFDAAYPPPVLGGKEKQAHLLARALCERGIDVRALSYCHTGNKTGEHDGIYVDRVATGALAPIRLLFCLARQRGRYDVLHVHTPSRIGRYAALVGRLCGFEVMFKFPSVRMLENLSGFEAFSWRLVLRACGTLVVLAQQAADELRTLGVPAEKIFFVPNGVEMPAMARDESHNAQAHLLYVGRLIELKRCSDILRACANLPEQLPWRMTFVGEGPERASLIRLAAELGIADRVDFIGHHARPLSLMEQADILILASTREGMPNVVLEAMSIGLPVISTPVGAVPEMLGAAAAYYTFPVRDVAALSELIERLLNDDGERRRYGAALRARCEERFSIDYVAHLYAERYRAIVK